MPPAGTVLRRALLVWGWGHVTLGDRRGWLFAVIQVLAIADWLIVALQLIDGTLWLVIFVPLVLIIVFWVAQAVDAYRRALRLGAAPGGELQLALFLPVVLAVFTSFWLVGGRHGSAASTVEAYMEAWRANRADLAVNLYREPRIGQADVAAFWQSERTLMTGLIELSQTTYGPTSGLDPDEPFSSLRVTQTGPTSFAVEIVRSETFQTSLLGFIQTSGTRTVVVARLFTITCVDQRVDGRLGASVWRIDQLGTVQGDVVPQSSLVH